MDIKKSICICFKKKKKKKLPEIKINLGSALWCIDPLTKNAEILLTINYDYYCIDGENIVITWYFIWSKIEKTINIYQLVAIS